MKKEHLGKLKGSPPPVVEVTIATASPISKEDFITQKFEHALEEVEGDLPFAESAKKFLIKNMDKVPTKLQEKAAKCLAAEEY